MNTAQYFVLDAAELIETPAAPVLSGVDTSRLAWSSSESAPSGRKKYIFSLNLINNQTLERGILPFTVFMRKSVSSHLSNSVGEDLDDLVVWCGDDTLTVDFNDAVPNTDASSLCYTAAHQTADLHRKREFHTNVSYKRKT